MGFRALFALPSLLNSKIPFGAPELDTYEYWALAQAIRRGSYSIGGVDWALRPPGYPAFLALSQDPRLAVALQILLLAGLSVLVAKWASEIGNRRAGLIAGILAATSPVLSLFSGFLLADVLFAALATLGLYLARKRVYLGGFALGLAGLVKPLSLTLALPVAVYQWLKGSPRRALGFLAALLFPLLPWTLRNWAVHGTPSVSTQPQLTVILYWAPYTMMAERGLPYPEALETLADTFGCQDLIEASYDAGKVRELLPKALGYLSRHPGSFLLAWAKGFALSFWGTGRSFVGMLWPGPVGLILVVFSWLHALLTYVLAFRGIRRMGGWGLALAAGVALLLLSVGPNGSFRFRAAAEPLLALWAGLALERL